MQKFGARGTINLKGRPLINAFDLSLAPGWNCLLGPSGSGKSTLLRLLAGLQTEAEFEGEVFAPDPIGWMGQSDLMQPRLTVAQNVMLIEKMAGRRPKQSQVEKWLERVGLSGFGNRYPDALSGGQRQRVALARTLMSEAELILLDEPFSALDPANRASMQELAFEQFQGRCVMLVTHDPTEALRLGSQIWLLSDASLKKIEPVVGEKPLEVSDPQLLTASSDLLMEIRRKT